MKTITIDGQLRTEFGKKATRQVRSQGNVPAVIYGGAKEVNFSAPAAAFKPLVYTPNFQIAEVKVGGDTYRCILKDLQFDKVTDELIHLDLLELVEDKKVIAAIPLKFTGTAKGVRAGGRFVSKIKSVKVKALPKHLTEVIEVPIDNLDINENIRIEDIKTQEMDILNSPRIPVASVEMTRQLKQEEAAAGKK
ncbi:MAG TPA: 50S ribosomal protein L25 [Niabella sp.]|nr:50S ribosomal protein L25 [Niabella sp.]HQW14682.1 50S ribosomal protein L25 [Niabella sp.]HQX19821.1 50S ribosomal protein L25 [Niabella sp.]HQX42286.1 50S ribosomal protein L25 [Niabella sp.]HRB08339.1 50S ribosomal protein L25 [Niabella sp.]